MQGDAVQKQRMQIAPNDYDVSLSQRDGTPHDKRVTPWRIALTIAVVSMAAVGIVLIFSDVFETGPHTVRALVEFGEHNTTIFAVVFVVALLLYLFDISYWEGGTSAFIFPWLRTAAYLFMVWAVIALGISLVRQYPYLPLCIFILMMPVLVVCLSATLLRRQSPSGISWAVGLAFLVASVLVLVLWLLWLVGSWGDNDNNFWVNNRAEFAEDAMCNASDFTVSGTYLTSDGVLVCTAAFLLWVSPLIIFGVLFFIAVFLIILSWRLDANPTHTGKTALNILAISAFTVMFGMYSVTSVGGAGMQLANVAMSIFFVMLVGIVLVGASAVGRQRSQQTYHSSRNALKTFLKNHPIVSNMGRAFLLCVGSPIFVLLLALSFLNQLVRKYALNRGKCEPLPAREQSQWVTDVFMRYLEIIRQWDWSTVLKYAYYFCAFAWTFIYFARITYIFFNWLVTVLQPLNFGLVVIIFICIGLIMFLIPVVPGPAVYLTAGVLIVPLTRAQLDGSGGANYTSSCDDGGSSGEDGSSSGDLGSFWIACAFASFLSWCLKLVAHVLQQKLIGEGALGGYVSVRAFVGINTRQMKAVRYLLSRPGITIAKASILCGGPDWPTSVLCGLLRLNCCQMLIGLTPIIIFTTPGTLLGAFLTEPAYSGANLDTVMTLLLVLIQVLMLVAFMHYINDAINMRAEELDSYDDDPDVAVLDRQAAHYKEIVAEVGTFDMAPLKLRLLLVSGVALSIISTWILYFGPELLFQTDFTITTCLSLLGVPESDYIIPPLGLKPAGLGCILLMIYGGVCLWLWGKLWVHAQALERLESEMTPRLAEPSHGHATTYAGAPEPASPRLTGAAAGPTMMGTAAADPVAAALAGGLMACYATTSGGVSSAASASASSRPVSPVLGSGYQDLSPRTAPPALDTADFYVSGRGSGPRSPEKSESTAYHAEL